MEKFEQFKTEILARAKAANACTEQYSRALHAETLDALLDVVRDNFGWAVNAGVLTGEFIDEWKDEFATGRIWHNCNVENGYLLATEGRVEARGNATVVAGGNASVVAWGNSSVVAWGNATVVARDNSSVEAWGNATVEARGNATVKAWGNATVVAWGNATVVAWDNSSVEAGGNSSVEVGDNSSVVAWGNSSVVAWGNATVVAWGNSSVVAGDNSSVVAGDNSYTTSYGVIECKLNGHAIHRIRKTNTIRYADKDMKFELVADNGQHE